MTLKLEENIHQQQTEPGSLRCTQEDELQRGWGARVMRLRSNWKHRSSLGAPCFLRGLEKLEGAPMLATLEFFPESWPWPACNGSAGKPARTHCTRS